jgi:hypothetical protein
MKPYTKPTIEIDSDVFRMLTKQGFADLFWERLCEARKENQSTTQESVFNALNEKYQKVLGETKYSSFDSFRIVRDKK